MIIFLGLCAFLAVIGIVWLYQVAQGRERGASDKKLTDALQKLKTRGANAARKHRDKDN